MNDEQPSKLYFQKDGEDILQGIELRCTKAIWECYDVFHVGILIAKIMFGKPTECFEGYSWRIEEPTQDVPVVPCGQADDVKEG